MEILQQSRWALAAANIPYESVFLITADDFSQLRASGRLTYGQVPMLEDGEGVCLSQSLTIVRHCARKGGLYGTSDIEAAKIGEVIDGIKDGRGAIVGYPFGDPREACMQLAGAAERFFPCFEQIIQKNNHPPFAVGAALTMADVLLAELIESTTEALRATCRPAGRHAGAGGLSAHEEAARARRGAAGDPELQGVAQLDALSSGRVGQGVRAECEDGDGAVGCACAVRRAANLRAHGSCTSERDEKCVYNRMKLDTDTYYTHKLL